MIPSPNEEDRAEKGSKLRRDKSQTGPREKPVQQVRDLLELKETKLWKKHQHQSQHYYKNLLPQHLCACNHERSFRKVSYQCLMSSQPVWLSQGNI